MAGKGLALASGGDCSGNRSELRHRKRKRRDRPAFYHTAKATNYLEAAAEAAEAEAEPEAFFEAAEAEAEAFFEAEAEAEAGAEAEAEPEADAEAEAAKAEAANRPAIRAAITFFILMSFVLTC
jgi:hypothetical protein